MLSRLMSLDLSEEAGLSCPQVSTVHGISSLILAPLVVRQGCSSLPLQGRGGGEPHKGSPSWHSCAMVCCSLGMVCFISGHGSLLILCHQRSFYS